MNRKQELLASSRTAFDKWEEILAGRTEQQIIARARPGEWSISDIVAHLTAWQQVSIARLEAALRDSEPEYPAWLGGADPFFAEEHVDDFNARIHALHRDEPWPTVYRSWRGGYQRFLELCEAVPEKDMFETGRYGWLKGHALAAVLEGWTEHHQEHYESLSARLAAARSK